jgi:Flp pilus assembly protein TadG
MKTSTIMLRMIRQWLVCERGATAAEFALIAVPFIGLLLAMTQTALVFFLGQVLQNATAEAGRLVMTGQAVGMTPAQFQQSVCDHGHGFFTCSKLSVNVQTYGTFTAATQPVTLKNGKLDTTGFGFSAGKPGQIEVVQVFYAWPLGTDLLNLHLVNINGDSRLLVATSVFRNEPY